MYKIQNNHSYPKLGSATTQAISYIPYGEVFVEQQSGGWSSPYLFNAKELDSETGLYYYGARYLDPSDALWLSVDPLWEKYVGMTPYQYCMGNPVKYIDPNGENVYGVNSDGDVALIEKNDDDKDVLVAGVSVKNGEVVKDKKGKVKGLEYDENGNLKNKTINVQKNVLTERSIKEREFYDGAKGNRYCFDKKENASDFFEFMSQNTSVEWTFYDKGFEGGSVSFFVSTSHKWDREPIGTNDVFYNVEKQVTITTFHIHSHPFDAKVDAATNAKPSDLDMSFARKTQEADINNRNEELKFSIYSRKEYYDYTPKK